MRTDHYLVALALAASAVSASAGTVCVQNKQTGRYEPKSPSAGTAADCALLNVAAANAVAQPTNPFRPVTPTPAPTPTPAAAPVSRAPSHPAPGSERAQAPAAAAAAAAAPVDAATQSRNYRLKFSDVTVRLGMKRWLKDVNMQLAYEAQKDFPVPIEGDYTGPISDVMLKLMKSLSQSTYPLRTCEYDNRVFLVVHRDEKCPLEDEQ